MASTSFGRILKRIQKLAAALPLETGGDAQVLQRFVRDRDETAFEILVRRHGPLVLGVSRQVLGDIHGAEDVFQAVFMVLARKAESIRSEGSLAPWLYRIALHLALETRGRNARRRHHEKQVAEMTQTNSDAGALDDWQPLLHEEVGRLPASFRDAVVLCYFEGKPYDAAAAELGWTQATVRGRLARARELLRKRLTRRGLNASAGLPPALLAQPVKAVVPSTLIAITGRSAASFVLGEAGAVSTTVQALAEVGLTAAEAGKGVMNFAWTALLILGLVGTGVGLIHLAAEPSAGPATSAEAISPQIEPVLGRTDAVGDPLPAGAVARLGTTRFRHLVSVHSVVFLPDGKTLASSGGDKICLWDAGTGKETLRFENPHGTPRKIALAGKGELLIADGESWPQGGTLTAWEVATGKQVWEAATGKDLLPPALAIRVFAVSGDGKTIAVRGENNSIRLLEAATGKLAKEVDGPTEPITEIAVAANGNSVATWSLDKKVRLWDTVDAKEIRQFSVDDGAGMLAFAPDGKTLAAAGREVVIVFEFESGKEIGRFSGEIFQCLSFSPKGDLLAAGDFPNIHLWNLRSGKEIRKIFVGTYVHGLAFSPDGQTVASADGNHVVRLWNPYTGEEHFRLPGHQGDVRALAMSSDGRFLVSGAFDSAVQLWDLSTLKQIHSLSRREVTDDSWVGLFKSAVVTERSQTRVSAVAISPDNRTVAAAGDDGAIHVWDVAAGKEVRQLFDAKHHTIASAYKFAFTPDGRRILSQDELAVRCWDLTTNKLLWRLEEDAIKGENPNVHYSAIALAPNGKEFALARNKFIANTEAEIQFFDVDTGKPKKKDSLTWQGDSTALFYSPDGRFLASVQLPSTPDLKSICVWDLATNKIAFQIDGKEARIDGRILHAVFSPDGKTLAALAERSGVIVWEVATGSERGRWNGKQNAKLGSYMHDGQSPLAFTPNGRLLASGGYDTTILLWDITGRAPEGKLQSIRLTDAELDELWKDLANSDAAKAGKAIWALVTGAEQSVPFLVRQLAPKPADAEKSAKLLADLDSDTFSARDQAAEQLEKMGDSVEVPLRAALKGKTSIEFRLRVERLLEQLKNSPERLRMLRAVEVLEQIGNVDVRQAYKKWAEGPAEMGLTQEAKAALDRLEKRSSASR